MKRLIVYDLDGTLVDTSRDITQAVNYMLAQLDGRLLSVDEVRRYVGRGMRDLVASSLQRDDPMLVDEAERMFAAYYAEHLADFSALYPGAQDTLDFFHPRPQAVLTNKPNPFSRQLLTSLGVLEYFTDIVAGEHPYPRKPDPTGARALMDAVGAAPEETLLIGDSPVDIETGRNAGIHTIVMTHGFVSAPELRAARPDDVVDSFETLLALVKARGW